MPKKRLPQDKKGAEIAISTIVMIVLGLAVLVILILVVRQQVTKGAGQYGEISESIGGGAGCFNILEGRSCVKGRNCPPDMTPVTGTWPDCVEKGKATKPQSTFVCCKKTA